MSEDATLDEFIEEIQNQDGEIREVRLGPVTTSFPEDWDVQRLDSLYRKKSIGTNERGTSKQETIPLVKMGDLRRSEVAIRNPEEEIEKNEELLEEYGLEKGDFLFNTRNTPELVGKTGVWDSDYPAIYDNNLLRVRFKSHISSFFVNYFLSSEVGWRQARGHVHGTTSVAAIYDGEFDKLQIPIPKIEEQRKISAILYTIDRAIEKSNEIENQILRIKRGVAQDLFHKGVEDDETQDTWLGEIPASWDIIQFSNLISSSRNGIYKKEDAYGGETPILKMGDMFGEVVFSGGDMERIELNDDEKERFQIRKGDLLFARRSLNIEGAGECTLIGDLQERTVFESSLIRVRLTEDVYPMFYAQYFGGPVGSKSINRIVTTTTASGIAGSDLKNLRVPYPKISTQKEIATKLSTYDSRIKILKRNKSQLQRLKKGLMQDLLSGTVRTTNTNIEVPDEIAQYG